MSQDLIENFREFVYEPSREQEVVALFFRILPKLDIPICIEEVRGAFPDCLAYKETDNGFEEFNIEFELFSQNFLKHGHEEEECDLIVCWEDNCDNCSVETLELKDKLEQMETDLILKDKPKYEKGNWTKEEFLEEVEEANPEIYIIQKNIYDRLTEDGGIDVQTGNGTQPTYQFSVPSTDNEANFGVYSSGKTWIDYKDMTDREKGELISKLENCLHINLHQGKKWERGPSIGEDITKDNLEEFFSIILEG